MTYNEIFDKVAELIVAQLPVTIEQVKPESSWWRIWARTART